MKRGECQVSSEDMAESKSKFKEQREIEKKPHVKGRDSYTWRYAL
jgi:hypothetical protein